MTATSGPHHRLAAIVDRLQREVPDRFGILLAAPTFSRGKAALDALSRPGRQGAVIADLSVEEVNWLADELERRWTRLVPVRMEGGVQLICPREVWLPGGGARIDLQVRAPQLVDGWEVTWPDRAVPHGPASASLEVTESQAPVTVIRVRVAGRRLPDGPREALHASARIELRRPVWSLSDDGTRVRVHDAAGYPAAGIMFEIEGKTQKTDEDGEIRVEMPPAAEARVTMAGAPVPRSVPPAEE
ncbi:hypothetical protein [Mesorhizobium sp. CN2-181]|uniref:hypothetical protein n=1 Tax=Mesorhizobium yinganensis TaxID=3157707 RepID=UPI0032B7B004